MESLRTGRPRHLTSPNNGQPDWAKVCDLDSDGDGFSNGVELGDPDCVWDGRVAQPPGPLFNPGNPNSFPEGVVEQRPNPNPSRPRTSARSRSRSLNPKSVRTWPGRT